MGFPPTALELDSRFYSRMGYMLMTREGKDSKNRKRREKRRGEEDPHREQTGSMSRCLGGGVIPPSKNVITSNSVLMRLHGEDKNKL